MFGDINIGTVALAILVVLILILIVSNIQIVQQSKAYVVERLGAFHAVWGVGLHLKVPFIERVVKKVSLKEQVADFDPQPVITKDNVTMQIDTVIYFQITDPKLYTYGVEYPMSAIENLTATTLRNIIGELELDQSLTGQINRLEGYLFPDTYEFSTEKTAVFAIDTMLTNFNTKVSNELLSEIQESGYTFREIITMASIIEKEAIGDYEERTNVASVLYNRLNNPDAETAGLLQVDASIDYALRLEGKDRSEFSTELDSPYNTYIHAGLPVGPICNPSLASIRAALNPSQTDYYYYALGTDGVHHFFRTYSEHLAFVNSDMYAPA